MQKLLLSRRKEYTGYLNEDSLSVLYYINIF